MAGVFPKRAFFFNVRYVTPQIGLYGEGAPEIMFQGSFCAPDAPGALLRGFNKYQLNCSKYIIINIINTIYIKFSSTMCFLAI